MNIKKLNPFSSGISNELVAIDFSANSLNIVQVRVSLNKREVVNLFNRTISSLSDEDIVKMLKGVFLERKPKAAKIVSIIPSHLAITKNIEIPSADPREIREIISLQAGRHTPYSREEIIIDHIEIGTYKNSYTKILLVIVARNIVKRQYEILDRAGLKLEKVFFAPEALAWAVSKMLKIESDSAPLNIIHIDEGLTDFMVMFKKKPVFVRSISIGIQHLAQEREKYQLRLAEELKKSLEAYQSEGIGEGPSRVIITGAIEEMGGLEAVLAETLLLPVRLMPYFNNLSISAEAFKAASSARRVSFLNLIAPLLGYDELKVDLVPEEIKLRKALEERGRDLIKTGIFSLSLFVLVFFILLSEIFFKSAYLKRLNARYQPLIVQAQKLDEDNTRITTIRHYLENRGYSLEALTELYKITPLEIELNDIRQDERGKFSLKGTAQTMSTAYTFVEIMEKSKYFKDVKNTYATKRRDGLKEVADFELKAALERESD